MSYLVLARKFRPQCFEDVVGQRAVVRTLQNALDRNRVPHALIFSGVRGVGKTTLARIMAKALNCEQGPSSSPCNTCKSCQGIKNGSSVDLHEVDGASNRGIQEIRELKEKIRFMPTGARYKIFIIDEVHMLTTEAFNALLKTLEEPPDHVYFMLATTELHRVPVTILSRCQRYELKRVEHTELAAHFHRLAELEHISIAPSALNLIVREAGGSVRDGLSLLDQVFSYCGEHVSEEEVVEILGLVSHTVVSDIASSLLTGDLAGTLEQLDKAYSYGIDLKRFINDLLKWFRALVVCKVTREPDKLLDMPDDEYALLVKTASQYSKETLSLMFHVLFEGLEKVSFATRPRFALEMAFIRAVQVGEVVPADEILHKLDTLLAGIPLEKKTQTGKREFSADEKSVRIADSRQSSEQTIAPDYNEEKNENTKLSVQHSESVQTAAQGNAKPSVKDSGQSVPSKFAPSYSDEGKKGIHASERSGRRRNVRQHWKDFIEYVRDRKRWMASALERAASVHLEKDELLLHYVNSVDCRLLRNRENVTPLTEFALDFFQENFRIRFESPDLNKGAGDSENDLSPQQERQDLANDPLVLTALDVFNGQVGDIRVGPRFRVKIPEEDDSQEESTDVLDE